MLKTVRAFFETGGFCRRGAKMQQGNKEVDDGSEEFNVLPVQRKVMDGVGRTRGVINVTFYYWRNWAQGVQGVKLNECRANQAAQGVE